jgi:hypothetical protein
MFLEPGSTVLETFGVDCTAATTDLVRVPMNPGFSESEARSTAERCYGLDGQGNVAFRGIPRRVRWSASLQQEVKAILERVAGTLTMNEARRLSERWSADSAGGRSPTACDRSARIAIQR